MILKHASQHQPTNLTKLPKAIVFLNLMLEFYLLIN